MNSDKPTSEARIRVIATAFHDRLEPTRRRHANRSLADELDEIARHCASLPVLDDRVAEEILGYDECGLLVQ